jgi:hypothetical protein
MKHLANLTATADLKNASSSSFSFNAALAENGPN